MQTASAVDLRRHPRLAVQVAVLLDSGNTTFAAYTRDISWGGAFVETPRPFPPNSLLSVILQIPDEVDPLEFDARVTHRRSGDNGAPAGVGIEFLTITERHRPALAGFLQHLTDGDEVLS